jgi:hypothetical protein
LLFSRDRARSGAARGLPIVPTVVGVIMNMTTMVYTAGAWIVACGGMDLRHQCSRPIAFAFAGGR